MAAEKKSVDAEGKFKTLIVILIILALTAATYFAFSYYLSLGQARLLLTEGKSAQLAVWSVSVEYSATGAKFSDVTSKSGMTDKAAEKAKSLCGLSGDISLRQADKNGYGIIWLTYEKDGYMVEFTDYDGNEQWRVYKKEVMIKPD